MSVLEPLPEEVGVSYVMPVLNEATHLEAAVHSIQQQDYAGSVEILLALGESSDDTDTVAAALATADERVKLLRNPANHIPNGMNLGIAAAQYEVVVRVDAHSVLPEGYTSAAVEALRRTGAANVGGRMIAEGDTPFQQAVARAYNSPFGTGGGVYHHSEEEADADSAYLGVFRREVLLEVGGYDETLLRAEDWELNDRIRKAGYRVVFTPQLRVIYRPRSSVKALAKQMYATGAWRGDLIRRQRATPWRYLPPPLVTLVVIAGVGVTILRILTLGRSEKIGGWLGTLAQLGTAGYLAGVKVVAHTKMESNSGVDWRNNVLVLLTMHLAWGAGFLKGVTLGAQRTLDRSRVV